MPKNKHGGKGFKKGKKNPNANSARVLLFREDCQYYAKVTKMTGDRNLRAVIERDPADKKKNNHDAICHIRGKLRKRCWIRPGDVILVSEREFQTGDLPTYDVLHKYEPGEAKNLISYGEINSSNFIEEINEGDTTVEFGENGDFDDDDDNLEGI